MSLDRQRSTEASELRGRQWKEASTESNWKGRELVKSRAVPGPWCWHAPPRQLQILLKWLPRAFCPCPESTYLRGQELAWHSEAAWYPAELNRGQGPELPEAAPGPIFAWVLQSKPQPEPPSLWIPRAKVKGYSEPPPRGHSCPRSSLPCAGPIHRVPGPCCGSASTSLMASAEPPASPWALVSLYVCGGRVLGWMVSRGPPALTACPPGDSSNTRLLSARTNIWESVMKGLGEKEGVSQNRENSHSSTSTTGNGGGVGEGSGGCGMWGAPPPRTGPLYSAPSCPGRPRREGPGAGPRGGHPTQHGFGSPWKLLNPKPPPTPPGSRWGE